MKVIVLLIVCIAVVYCDVCTTTQLHIRKGPNMESEVLWTAMQGEKFELMKYGDWFHVKSVSGSHKGTHGYGYSTYFQDCDNTLGNYSRSEALVYAAKFWKTPNHDCQKGYQSCSPWSVWGDYCGYPSHGGDCANFVSQCLVTAGHPYLNQGFPCRGFPCGKEEIGARNLGNCLSEVHHWKRTCGNKQPPPHDLKVGDVLIYHAGSCDSIEAHATIVTKIIGGDVRISCHSPSLHDHDYRQVSSTKTYYEWLQYHH